uniref:(northern house mosquito) hypothetical protein n=1 Tax=Culex pipiens TaxID=7175 RepID=A0A8D8BI40_CULPI
MQPSAGVLRHGGRDLPVRDLPPAGLPRGDGPHQGDELPDVPAPERHGRPRPHGHDGLEHGDAGAEPRALALRITVNATPEPVCTQEQPGRTEQYLHAGARVRRPSELRRGGSI